jgi:hypothetical protein
MASGVKGALGKCEHVNEMLAILGIASEYGKNCIAAERHDGAMMVYLRVQLGFRVFSLPNSLGHRGERFQESCV